MSILRWIVGGIALIVLASCKVNFVVPEGGEIVFPEYPGEKCSAGNSCWVHVVDFYFDATAVAVPAAGYEFKHWKRGNRRFCGGSKEPCRLTTTPFTGEWIPIIQPFLDNPEEEFYLEPVFEKISANPVAITGTWSGSANDSSGPGKMTWVLSQVGDSFSGNVKATDLSSGVQITGKVTGTISGLTLRFTITIPPGGFGGGRYASCSAQLSGTANLSGHPFSGNYSGNNTCAGPVNFGNLTMTKQ